MFAQKSSKSAGRSTRTTRRSRIPLEYSVAMPSLVYVGSYTRSGRAQGIEVFSHDAATGALSHLRTTEEMDPSFLAFDPRKQFLFAVSEGEGKDNGEVVSFRIDAEGLTRLSRQKTGGGEPCHLTADPSGRWLLVANHEHGSVAVFPIDDGGRLGERSDLAQHHGSGPGPTQEGPHAHFVTFDPPQQRALVCDKGIDQVVFYTLANGKLIPAGHGTLHPGAAPRHLAFHPSGQYAYVNGEADMTITAFAYGESMRELQVLPTVPEGTDLSGCSTAHILVHPNGRFVYVSNRGHDSIAIFAIDPATGLIEARGNPSTEGRTPRNFTIDPSGTWLYAANQNSDTIVQFLIDPDSGQLSPTGNVTEVGAPVCIVFA
jgi:6-phosphogluconolactonase